MKCTDITTVYVLSIDHRHGRNVSVFEDQEDALAALFDYCESWWADVADNGPIPGSPGELIEEYFRRQEGREYYDITETELKQRGGQP